ncbi:hypothetical protein CPB97_007716 [Podila verticillata]|nr:hypothetical protein CPB97_007716 [Podila verticillata]
MANLHGFRDDLLLEQEHRKRIAPKEAVPAAGNNNKGQSLGLVFLVLFQASRSAVKKALANLEAENVLSNSLRGLVTHVRVEGRPPLKDDTDAIVRMQEVYRPLLDKIMKKSDDSGKKIAYLLLDWLLLEYPFRDLMARSLSQDFAPQADKRQKLASLLAVEHAFSTYNKNAASVESAKSDAASEVESTGSPLDTYQKVESAVAVFRDAKVLTQWDAQLANIILHDGTTTQDGSRSMTRLTGLALDLMVAFSRILSTQAQQEIKTASSNPKTPTLVVELDSDTRENGDEGHKTTFGWGFSMCMIDMCQVIKEVQMWHSKGGRLLTASLGDTTEMISRFNRHQGNKTTGATWLEILSSFTRIWDIISVALTHSTASSSPSVLLDQAIQYAKNDAIPPYIRLIVTGIYLGYYEQTMPINDVLQNDGLGLTLLAHSTFIVSERIPVGNKIAAVVRDVTLPLMTDVEIAQVWSLITKKLFDQSVELDFATLGVIAQYMLARPKNLLPDIMGRFTVPNPQNPSKQDEVTTNRNRSLLGVVSMLSDMDFFTLPLGQEAEAARSALADLVIGFLYDRDLNSRMTASHIVASLDPVRTIQTFGPDLASPDKSIRSTGALILIECMLSQKQDGSIGEGLCCFIDYTRSVSRGCSTIVSSREVVKSPSQLMSRSKLLSSPTSQGTAAKGVSEEVLFNVLKRMGDATPPPVWPSVVQIILSKMYSSPSDPVLMRIWNTLVPAISTSSEAIAATFLGVTEIMERQGEVSESLLEAAMEASDEGLDDLRMSRTLPFTVLKAIPMALYMQALSTLEQRGEDVSIRTCLKPLLTSRTENDHEFNRVRELAAETLKDMFSE